MGRGASQEPGAEAAVGLCSVCRFGVRQPTRRGSAFWRCRRAESDPSYLRYPPLPVLACPGFERASGRRPR